MAGKGFAAVWPLKSKDKSYVIVPVNCLKNYDPINSKKGELIKYKPPGSLTSSLGQVLVCAPSKQAVIKRFQELPRIIYPSRRQTDLNQSPSSSDEFSQQSQQSKRQSNAIAFLANKMGAKQNTEKILALHQKQLTNQLKKTANIQKCNASMIAGAGETRSDVAVSQELGETETSVTTASSSGGFSHGGVIMNVDNSPEDSISAPEKGIQKKGLRGSPKEDDAGDLPFNIMSALQEMRQLKEDIVRREQNAAALQLKAESDLTKVQEILEAVVQERKRVEEESKRVAQEAQAAQTALTTAVDASAVKLDQQRLQIVDTLNQKIKEFQGVSSSASSCASSSASSSKSSTSGDNKTTDDDSPDLNAKICIGDGLMVNSYLWNLGKCAKSNGEWALYAIRAVYGKDAMKYRAATPRSKSEGLLVFPKTSLHTLQKHYRVFLINNPAVLWAKKQKRRKRKNAPQQPEVDNDEEQRDSDLSGEETGGGSPKTHTPNETKAKLKERIEALPGLMADKAIYLWRLFKGKTGDSAEKRSSTKEAKEDGPPVPRILATTNRGSPARAENSAHEYHNNSNDETTETETGAEDLSQEASSSAIISRSSSPDTIRSTGSFGADLSPHSKRFLSAGFARAQDKSIAEFCSHLSFSPVIASTEAVHPDAEFENNQHVPCSADDLRVQSDTDYDDDDATQ